MVTRTNKTITVNGIIFPVFHCDNRDTYVSSVVVQEDVFYLISVCHGDDGLAYGEIIELNHDRRKQFDIEEPRDDIDIVLKKVGLAIEERTQ